MHGDFRIGINKENGGLSSIVNSWDNHHMNWCETETSNSWGTVKDMQFVSASEEGSLYKNSRLLLTVKRGFNESNRFFERYTFTNSTENEVFIKRGDIGIYTTFNDNYDSAEICETAKCNTHIWCGENVTYVNALRMGVSDINLGLVLTRGSIDAYSLEKPFDRGSDDRGDFILHPSAFTVLPGEDYILEWELFWHKGKEDFREILNTYSAFIDIQTEYFTVFEGESIRFTAKALNGIKESRVIIDNEEIEHTVFGSSVIVDYSPKRTGEHTFHLCVNGISTLARFFVSPPLDNVIKNRVAFIVEKQQHHGEKSRLNGAYLIYDNEENRTYYDAVWPDHNACRERLGMGLMIASYLQKNNDPQVYASFIKYIGFVMRELFDCETGETYGEVGKNPKNIRLYNPPWMATLLTEIFYVTGDSKYAEYSYKALLFYYSNGGKEFYPNGLVIDRIMSALRECGMTGEYSHLAKLFATHADNIIKKGHIYPKHEVSFEQTIVSPAVRIILHTYFITGDKKYLEAVKPHLSMLERFQFSQPDHHLNEIPIRHWDDFWFGKRKMYGDTFPHYWSCLSADSYDLYYNATGDTVYLKKAETTFRNCMSLFRDDGSASCAYVYPFTVNGIRCEFYDEFANDQDFALYFYEKRKGLQWKKSEWQ